MLCLVHVGDVDQSKKFLYGFPGTYIDLKEQESIPVGRVPPACQTCLIISQVHVSGGGGDEYPPQGVCIPRKDMGYPPPPRGGQND